MTAPAGRQPETNGLPLTFRARLLWAAVALLGALALAVVVGVIHPQEKVNAIWVVVAAACVYVLAYRFYAAFLATRVVCCRADRPTPANTQTDGVDYFPTPKWVLFGHHFAAIAGAGPIIGPTLAAQFGYLPGFLWILIGGVLAGAVQDMVVLAASVRNRGLSLAQLVRGELGRVAWVAAVLLILFNIVVAVAGAGLAVVNALHGSPWGTFTVAMTIPIAIFVGVGIFKFKRSITEGSVVGGIMLLLAVYGGSLIPGSRFAPWFDLSPRGLTCFIGGLSLLSAVLPVWVLLCPRDYISAYIKVGAFILIALGILINLPALEMPAVTTFVAGGGPVIPGSLFPFLFITIACGAISGFHALIASGTSPKMICSEAHIPVIGYGSMLTEGMVAVMALLCACVLIPGDYFAINTALNPEQLTALGFPVGRLAELSRDVGVELSGRPGGPVSLGLGMAVLLSGLAGGREMLPYWYNFALMFQAIFILTLVDTGTRVGRFLLQEILGHLWPRLAGNQSPVLIVLTSLAVVLAWVFLIATGTVATLWPMFGTANQLLSAIALAVGTTMILRSSARRYAWLTVLPLLFLLAVSYTAAWQLIGRFYAKAGLATTTAAEAINLRVSGSLIAVVGIFAAVLLVYFVRCWLALRRQPDRPAAPGA